jgi:hypothetical protein
MTFPNHNSQPTYDQWRLAILTQLNASARAWSAARGQEPGPALRSAPAPTLERNV